MFLRGVWVQKSSGVVDKCIFGVQANTKKRLGASWGVWGASGEHLGASWERLVPPWGRLGGPQGRLGRQDEL